jgi:Skp family chaperone for outer membrane proteins
MSDTVMNLSFCDLCNESRPQADLDLGRAVRRNERLICAACEAAMSGGHRLPAPAVPPLGAPLNAPAGSGGATVAAMALAFASVALVAGVGAAAYLFWRGEQFAQDFRGDLAHVERAAPEHARTVSAALGEEIRARESELAAVRSEVQSLTARLAEFERAEEGRRLLERRVEKHEERLEGLTDLSNRVQHQGRAVDELASRVEVLATERRRVPEAAEPAPIAQDPDLEPDVPEAAPREALWQKWIADLSSADSGTRWQAVQALGATHDAEVVPHTVPMLDDGDIFVRMAACRHLGDLGSIDAIPALIDTLEDEESSVREAALVALRELSGQSIPFDPLARDGDRSKRVKAWRDWWEDAAKDLKNAPKPRSKG